MIASGYSMDLYCDGVGCTHKSWQPNAKAQFTGETFGDCAAQAKRGGWKISRDRTKCLCPDCAKAGRSYATDN